MSELTIRLYEESQDNVESLYYQAASEIYQLKAELEFYQKQEMKAHKDCDDLERQLAEARAEGAEFKATIQPGCCGIATCPGVAEARQEAARECLEIVKSLKVTSELIEIKYRIMLKFGLEG